MSNEVTIVYVGMQPAVDVPGVGRFVKGEPAVVPVEVADRLLEQSNWSEFDNTPEEAPVEEE